MAAVRDDDLRKAHADCRYASSNAEQYSSLGTPALRSDLLLQHGRALRAANAHLPNLDHHVVTQIESSLRESLKRCVLTRWDDGVPEAFAPGQDEGKLLRSFPQTIRSTVTESQSGKLRGAALFEPPKWQPRWP